MTSVSHTHPFKYCPDKRLLVASNVDGNQIMPVKSAHMGNINPTSGGLGGLLYDDLKLLQSCPYEKSREDCMDRIRSRDIFLALHGQPDIVNGKCGNLNTLASIIPVCSPGMSRLTQAIIQSPGSSATQTILAQEISSTCHFPIETSPIPPN
jgi:hypothetical protein